MNQCDVGRTYLEGNTLRMFVHSALRKIFDPKREEVMGGWRKLHI
jgi:hypothetical protein